MERFDRLCQSVAGRFANMRLSMSISQAQQGLSRREFSSEELVRLALKQAHCHEPRLNAFIRLDDTHALARARSSDSERAAGQCRGPLHGIPMAFKDMFGFPPARTSFGSKLDLPPPTETAPVLRHLEDSGVIQIGALNMSPFAIGAAGQNIDFGPSRNPWNIAHVAGGSSSGAGSAVAARTIFAALGSDTGGSIRIPAALCGTCGLKPTYGLLSRRGVMGMAPSLDTVGVIARDAGDCALMLNALAVWEPSDATLIYRKLNSFTASRRSSIKGMRIGVPHDCLMENVDSEVGAQFDRSISTLCSLGALKVDVDASAMKIAHSAASLLIACEAGAAHSRTMRDHSECYPGETRMRLEAGFAIPAHIYINTLRSRASLLEQFIACTLADADVLLTPTVPVQAPRIDELARSDLALSEILSTFTRPVNFLGLPAMAIPMGFSSSGLPLSLQIIGRPFAERDLLDLADAFQRETGWHEVSPAANHDYEENHG